MAYTNRLIRCTFEGTLNNSEEVFYFGLWLRPVSEPGGIDEWNLGLIGLADQINTDLVALFTSTLKAFFSPAMKITTIRLTHVDEQGKTLHQVEKAVNNGAGILGTGTVSMPFSSTVVVSMFGYADGIFTPNRARKRGRFYLPPVATNTMSSSTGRLSSSAAQALANFGKQLTVLLDGNTMGELGPAVDVVIPSSIDATTLPVLRVQVGDVPDVQRRRRNQMVEFYYNGV